MSSGGWHGVDLDGTLAVYDHWRGIEHIGEPIGLMYYRVAQWLDRGEEVRVVTARVGDPQWSSKGLYAYTLWCERHFGRFILVTDRKDYNMIDLWDDRAVTVEKNTGRILAEPSPAPNLI